MNDEEYQQYAVGIRHAALDFALRHIEASKPSYTVSEVDLMRIAYKLENYLITGRTYIDEPRTFNF